MLFQDVINGGFELISGVLIWINVIKMMQDKCLKGISAIPVMFFTLWGFWNLYFYPHLNLWLSFVGVLSIVIANAVWLALVFKFWKQRGK